jgi:hypothetical protein
MNTDKKEMRNGGGRTAQIDMDEQKWEALTEGFLGAIFEVAQAALPLRTLTRIRESYITRMQ